MSQALSIQIPPFQKSCSFSKRAFNLLAIFKILLFPSDTCDATFSYLSVLKYLFDMLSLIILRSAVFAGIISVCFFFRFLIGLIPHILWFFVCEFISAHNLCRIVLRWRTFWPRIYVRRGLKLEVLRANFRHPLRSCFNLGPVNRLEFMVLLYRARFFSSSLKEGVFLKNICPIQRSMISQGLALVTLTP